MRTVLLSKIESILIKLERSTEVNLRKCLFALIVLGLAFGTTAIASGGTGAGHDDGTWVWWISPIGALMALGFAIYFYKKMMGASEGTEKMIEIARHVREGAYAYLFRQYSVVTIVFIVLLAIFGFLAYKGVQNHLCLWPFLPAVSLAVYAVF